MKGATHNLLDKHKEKLLLYLYWPSKYKSVFLLYPDLQQYIYDNDL